MRRLAFIDLDLTLFDYTATRRHATAAALQAMGLKRPAPLGRFIETVVGRHGDVLQDLGFPNFRRKWFALELFALAYLIDTRPELAEGFRRMLASQFPSGMTFRDRWDRRALLQRRARKTGLLDLAGRVGELLHDAEVRRRIDDAVVTFDEFLAREMRELPGADRLLDDLEGAGFESYVVTEGDEDIQKGKLSRLSAGERVGRVFVTAECCRSGMLVDDLWQLTAGGGEREGRTVDALEVLHDFILDFAVKTPPFFRKVVQTLLLPRARWDEFYRGFRWLAGEELAAAGEVGLLLVGDRYEKDLLPALRAFETVGTIRLEMGKYRSTYRKEALEELGLPQPSATVRSLNGARKVLSRMGAVPPIDRARMQAPPLPSAEIETLSAAVALVEGRLPAESAEQLGDLGRSLKSMEVIADGS